MRESFNNALVVAAFAPYLLYWLVLTARRRWWRNAAGWTVWLLALVCSVALLGPMLRQLTGARLPIAVGYATFLLITAVGWFQLAAYLVTLLRLRRGAAPSPEDG